MHRFVIRSLDVLLSLIGLVILAAPMGFISSVIWISDRGSSPLFRQTRVGRDLNHFTLYKFRTMTVDANRFQGDTSGCHEGVVAARLAFKTTVDGDPRITRIGLLLRKSHLDELPQLVNVLRGEMSLVGVRPDTPVQEHDYSSEYWRQRHHLRPGLTGPAQLRSDAAAMDERGQLERQWLNNPSTGQYCRVLISTVSTVVGAKGN